MTRLSEPAVVARSKSSNARHPFTLRLAVTDDITYLEQFIPMSARGLGVPYYTANQVEQALAQQVLGLDHQLIDDQTFFVVEHAKNIVGCGGWSQRKTLFGGSSTSLPQAAPLLDPEQESARIRAFFVHPDWVRQGIGRLILEACEEAAKSAGFTKLTLVATLSGEAFYASLGFGVSEYLDIPLETGPSMAAIRMDKQLPKEMT